MAVITSLRLANGDSLVLDGKDASRRLLTVIKRKRNGYLLASNDGADDKTWSFDELYQIYIEGRMEHFSSNLAALDNKIAKLLEAEWEAWPLRLRFMARLREVYCTYVLELRKRGVPLMRAYKRAAKTVYRKHGKDWEFKHRQFDVIDKLERERKRRDPKPLHEEPELKEYKPATWSSIRRWFRIWKQCGYDVRSLVPRYHDRGYRSKRKQCNLHLQTNNSEPLCVYGAMEYIARTTFTEPPVGSVAAAYAELEKLFEKDGIDSVSITTFYDFIKRRFTAFEEHKARYGPKSAFFKFGIFIRREAPEKLLEEVEIDHTLLDVFVIDHQGHIQRPWLTLLICRTSRCIVGMHIGFEGPSYAATQRAIIHAISPKDVSNIPGIVNPWRCHGVMDALITDRGKELLSLSLQNAGRDVGYTIINLPGRMPHLKGTVERFFGTLNIRVLTRLEGSTFARTPHYYDPQAKARFSLSELAEKIIKWIVDDYHQSKHSGIGCSPAQRWEEKMEEFGVRPVPSFKDLVIKMGETVDRKIGNTGVTIGPITYSCDELKRLRKERGGLEDEWIIRRDPYDLGEVWLLDHKGKKWVRVPAVHQKTAKGITRFQAGIHMHVARRNVAKGDPITNAHIEEAISKTRTAAKEPGHARRKARYGADGALMCTVVGNNSLPILAGAKPIEDSTVYDCETTAQLSAPEPALTQQSNPATIPKAMQQMSKETEQSASRYNQLLEQRLYAKETI